MEFMDLFVPMTAAFITSSVIIEFLHFLLGLWLSKRQHKRMQEHYKEVAEQMGISPEDFMSKMEEQMNGMGGMPGMMDGPPGMMGMPMGNVMTTTSGGGSPADGHGQYL